MGPTPPGGALDAATLRRSLAVQRRVISALMLRELITRYGRYNLGVLWLVIEPMIFTLGVAMLWSLTGGGRSAALPIVAFAITGYSSVLLWRNTVSQSAHAIQANINLLYHRNVKVTDVLLSRSLLEVGGATASFGLLSVVFVLGEWMPPPHDLLQVLLGWLMLAWFGIALGMTVGAATAYSPIVERVWQPLAYLLFPLSGAAYMADWIPTDSRNVLLLLPMVHSVEYIREGFFGPVLRFHHDMGYMAVCNLALSLAGLWLARDAGYRVEAE